MPTLVCGIVDVFAERRLEGNPLAVVEGGDHLSSEVMRSIAREFNQAETTFILKPDTPSVDWKLRSFTAAGMEVFGAGHNALGAWLWLGYRGRLGDLAVARVFRQQIGEAVLPVRVELRGDLIHGAMGQSPLALGDVLPDIAPLAAALRLAHDLFVSRPAPRVASTGAGHLMVRVCDREAVDRAAPDPERLLRAMGNQIDQGCYLYALDESPGANTAYARFFNPSVGLVEDPATGSAAGPLAAYLLQQGLLGTQEVLKVEQGTKMGRRSLLTVGFTPNAELSGPGVMVMEGKLHVP
jgi:PhzF family phenazine biosynthesis protein